MAGRATRLAERQVLAPAPHRASGTLSIGRRAELKIEVEISSGGLLAIGGLVSAILLSTAVLVGVATRKNRR